MISEDFSKQLPKLRKCLAKHPIEKAWLFGSYARGEETADSDIDLLVIYDKDACVSLFAAGHILSDVEKEMGRKVDFVEDGCLFDFAKEYVEKDKILIYERRLETRGGSCIS